MDIAKKELDKYDLTDEDDTDVQFQIGEALITFQKQGDARAVAEKFGGNSIKMFLKRLSAQTYGRLFKVKKIFTSKNYPIGSMAPDPSDIYWENLGISFATRTKY